MFSVPWKMFFMVDIKFINNNEVKAFNLQRKVVQLGKSNPIFVYIFNIDKAPKVFNI